MESRFALPEIFRFRNKSGLSDNFLRTAICGLLLLAVWLLDFHWLAALIFWLTNIFLYFHPLFNSFSTLNSFFVFLLLALPTLRIPHLYAAGGAGAGQNIWLAVIIIFLGLLYYWLFGLKNLLFVEKKSWRYLLNLGLFYLLAINFFSWPMDYFWLKMAVFLVLAFILLRELLKQKDFNFFTGHENYFLMVVCLLLGEVAWLISWLPLSALISANIFFLSVYVLDIGLRPNPKP